MEDFIKELQFLPKINFVSLNSVDGLYSSNNESANDSETIDVAEEED